MKKRSNHKWVERNTYNASSWVTTVVGFMGYGIAHSNSLWQQGGIVLLSFIGVLLANIEAGKIINNFK